MGKHTELIATFQRRTGEQIPNKAATLIQDSTVGGGQFRVGTGEFNALVEGLYVHKKIDGVMTNYAQYSVGLERKLADSLFLDVAYRWAPGSAGASGMMANFNWSFNQKAQLVK
jgi:hypothetical protein